MRTKYIIAFIIFLFIGNNQIHSQEAKSFKANKVDSLIQVLRKNRRSAY